MKIYNSLTKKLEEFKPINKGKVKMYTCGPTVYDYAHIGHARTYSFWDTVKKWFRYKGWEVYHVMNITDVGHLMGDRDFGEDKIIKRALEKNMEPMVLVEKMIQEWIKDFKDLGIELPDLMPRATCHIPEIIEVVKLILKNGYGYNVGGTIYFDVEKYRKKYKYPEFIDLSFEELKKTERIPEEVVKEKKNPFDFALWKKATPGHILQWPSPWGYGYPGWHIECTVMSAKYLGDLFDIHGGGEDHKFPHHTNERAQAFAAFGKGLANYWMHVAFVKINGEKMSKSTGNFVYLREGLEKWGKDVLRFWFAQSHYRSQIDYTDENLEGAKNSYQSLLNFVYDLVEGGGSKDIEPIIKEFVNKFEKAMDNDFNTREAINTMFWLKKEFYEKDLFKGKREQLDKLYKKLVEFGNILGFNLDVNKRKEEKLEKISRDLVNLLLEVREELRKEKNYKLGDEIRAKLKDLGIQVSDTKEGTKIRL